MEMGREGEVQSDLVVTWAEMPRSLGHAFYDRLQTLLTEDGFDAFIETTCKPYYAPRMGAPSLPPGRYFRMHMVGYFEGIDSERGHRLALLGLLFAARLPSLANREKVPDHSGVVVAAPIHSAEAGGDARSHTGRGAEEPRRCGSCADV